MTLIELMVAIVILTTLLAGVLPLVSPNNDARKIADASRGLQTYFMQAQAEAQRRGRPVGVGFRETSPGSGVAIEAFQFAVPDPFAGRLRESRVRLRYPIGQYGNSPHSAIPVGGKDFVQLYEGRDVYLIEFVKAPLKRHPSEPRYDYDSDGFPYGMLNVGDVVNLEGNQFLIVDHDANIENLGNSNGNHSQLYCVLINDHGQTLHTLDQDSMEPGIARTYRVFRQPTTGNKFSPSSEQPYQFPTGIALDMQGSGLEGNGEPITFAQESEARRTTPPDDPKQIVIMFSPYGGIDSVWVNDGTVGGPAIERSGKKITGMSRIFLLLGRIENANPQHSDYDFSKFDYGRTADEEVRLMRNRVNWLNPDSRWFMITANSGGLKIEPNAVFDPRDENFRITGDNQAEATKIVQIEGAHGAEHGH